MKTVKQIVIAVTTVVSLSMAVSVWASVLVTIGDGTAGSGTGLIQNSDSWHWQWGIPRNEDDSNAVTLGDTYDLIDRGEGAPETIITQIALRLRDGMTLGSAFTFEDFTVKMSNATGGNFSGGLDLDYADNHGADVTTVASGPLTVGPIAAGQYDFIIPLDTPFQRDLSKNLVIEMLATLDSGASGEVFGGGGLELAINDGSGAPPVSTPLTSWRIYNGTFTTAAGGNNGDGYGYLQLELTYTAAPEPATLGLLAVGGLLVLWRRR